MPSIPADLAYGAFDAAPDAMVIVDDRGIVQYANRRVSALFGFSPEEITGQSVELLMPENLRDAHRHHRAQYGEHMRVRPMGAGLELFGRRRDGTHFPVEISLSPISNDARVLVAAAIRDVTDRKRVEQELRAARQHADEAREAADRANYANSRFLAMASHDLRQPLQTLILLNAMMDRKVVDPDMRHALAQQAQALSGMSRLVNTLLDISKLESGAIKPDPDDFAVAALFEELRSEFAELAAAKGLRIETGEATARVHSDRSLVGQVLRNLVANAIKYTREGSVSLRCLADPGSMVRIQVLDTGIGIAPAHLSRIYDEFYQVEAPTSHARDGYGLGLSIVRRIVALLGLKLDVQSNPGKGSAFTLELPAATNAATSPKTEHTPVLRERRSTTAHLLLVEDDASMRTAARMLLEVEGYRVITAASLAEALNAATAHSRIDLVISDYHLSDGENGRDVIAALRKELGPQLPAVLLTGDTSSVLRSLPGNAALKVASKPIDADELLCLLQELLADEARCDGPLRRSTDQQPSAALQRKA